MQACGLRRWHRHHRLAILPGRSLRAIHRLDALKLDEADALGFTVFRDREVLRGQPLHRPPILADNAYRLDNQARRASESRPTLGG